MKPFRAVSIAAMLAALAPGPVDSSVAIEEEEVVFRFQAPGARRVFLVGDFNAWNPTVDLMQDAGGRFETRLYLVPGFYRYRFIADGASTADSENPCLDEDGHSCFTLIERGGVLEIILGSTPVAGTRTDREEAALSAMARFDARPGAADLLGGIRCAFAIDGRFGVDCTVGFEGGVEEGGDARGASYLASGEASYALDGRVLRFFTRLPAALAEEEGALPLFGSTGPHRYPIGLMSRGALFEGRLIGGLDATFVYASRIEGYRSGLEEGAAPRDTSARRELLDSDIFGAKLGTKLGPADAQAIFRWDRRPLVGEWNAPGGAARFVGGFERVGMWGGRIALRAAGDCRVEGAFLVGAVDRTAPVRSGGTPYEREWERGHAFVAGVSRNGARVDAEAALSRTTLHDLASIGPADTRDGVAGSLAYEEGAFSARFSGAIEFYGASAAGNRFRLARGNFFLDGDDLSLDRVLFLSSRDVREVRFSVAWRREPLDGLPWGTGTSASLLRRTGAGPHAPRAVEARVSNGTRIHPRAAFILDMRGVSYRYGGARGDFVGAFLGLHAAIAPSRWCLVGCGVSPYAFDRWLYDDAGWGRERYIEDRNVFGALAGLGEEAASRRLFDAEEALADDWRFTVQAGFTF